MERMVCVENVLKYENMEFARCWKMCWKRKSGYMKNVDLMKKWPVENSVKNDNKIVQKVVDLSTIRAYNRDNFWVQNLFKSQK